MDKEDKKELEPPFTQEEKLGHYEHERAALLATYGVLASSTNPKYSREGILWNKEMLIKEAEAIRVDAKGGG